MSVLVFIVLAGVFIFWSPLKSLSESEDVYFSGEASFLTEGQYYDRLHASSGCSKKTIRLLRKDRKKRQKGEKKKKFLLEFVTKRGYRSHIDVYVLKKTETVEHWYVGFKRNTSKFSLPDSIFSSKDRNGRTQCRILLKGIGRDHDGYYLGDIEFSELEWLSWFESMIAGVGDDTVTRSLFPFAALLRELTGPFVTSLLAIFVFLQFPAYGVLVWFSRTRRLAIFKVFSILFIHCSALALYYYLN
jgi:hypothetical protein